MKKIAIVCPAHFFPIPAMFGGACEQLVTLVLNEHEKADNDIELTLIQKTFPKEQMESISKQKYSKTKRVYFKTNSFFEFFTKAINKILKTLKLKTRISSPYDRKVLKYLKQNNFDKVVFEGKQTTNLQKLKNVYKKEQFFLHIHGPSLWDVDFVGNIVSVSNYISNRWRIWLDNKNQKDVKTLVLSNVVDEDKFSKRISEEEKQNIRKYLGFSPEDFVILFCGRVIPEKGVKELIESISNLNEKIKLLIIGSPNFTKKDKSQYLQDVELLVKNNQEKIKFTGFIPNSDLFKYYQIAQVQVVPSVWEDPAPLIVIEGLNSGIAQIVTNSGGIPEYIDPNGSIILTKENNLVEQLATSINELFKDPERVKTMAQANFEHAQKFNKLNYYNNFIKLLEDKNDWKHIG